MGGGERSYEGRGGAVSVGEAIGHLGIGGLVGGPGDDGAGGGRIGGNGGDQRWRNRIVDADRNAGGGGGVADDVDGDGGESVGSVAGGGGIPGDGISRS